MNVGEQLVSSYLRFIRGCDFVQTNLYTVDAQGEIDVVAINLKEETVYLCEVAIHLTTGLLYNKGGQANNVTKLVEKFTRDIAYARRFLPQFKHRFMLWTPVVKDSRGASERNQLGHVREIERQLKQAFGIELECVYNDRFLEALREMRSFAGKETKELQCPVMRILQIEELLARHVAKLHSRPPPADASSAADEEELLGELLEGPSVGQ